MIQETPLLKVIIMWSFPIVSLALGLISWKRTKLKLPLMTLMVGLALQTFSYLEFRTASGVTGHALVALGKGFFVGLLYVYYAGLGMIQKPELRTRLEFKVVLLAGMVSLTLSNIVSPKTSEAFLAILFILFPAFFWSRLRTQDHFTIAASLFLPTMAFMSFILTWSEYLLDKFNLSPILWMLSFAAGFLIFLNMEEEK